MALATRTYRTICLALVAAVLLPAGAATTGQRKEELPESDSKELPEKFLAVAVNTFKQTLGRAEPAPLVLAIANSGSTELYILKSREPYVELWDAERKTRIRTTMDTPPPPPPDYYMREKGKRVLMQPVHKLEPGGGQVMVVRDALKRYHKYLDKGTYWLRLKFTTATVKKNMVVPRAQLRDKLWVRAHSPDRQFWLASNFVRIKIEVKK